MDSMDKCAFCAMREEATGHWVSGELKEVLPGTVRFAPHPYCPAQGECGLDLQWPRAEKNSYRNGRQNQENKTRVTSLPWTTHLLVGRHLPPKRRPLSAQMDDVFTVDIGLTGLANRQSQPRKPAFSFSSSPLYLLFPPSSFPVLIRESHPLTSGMTSDPDGGHWIFPFGWWPFTPLSFRSLSKPTSSRCQRHCLCFITERKPARIGASSFLCEEWLSDLGLLNLEKTMLGRCILPDSNYLKGYYEEDKVEGVEDGII